MPSLRYDVFTYKAFLRSCPVSVCNYQIKPILRFPRLVEGPGFRRSARGSPRTSVIPYHRLLRTARIIIAHRQDQSHPGSFYCAIISKDFRSGQLRSRYFTSRLSASSLGVSDLRRATLGLREAACFESQARFKGKKKVDTRSQTFPSPYTAPLETTTSALWNTFVYFPSFEPRSIGYGTRFKSDSSYKVLADVHKSDIVTFWRSERYACISRQAEPSLLTAG